MPLVLQFLWFLAAVVAIPFVATIVAVSVITFVIGMVVGFATAFSSWPMLMTIEQTAKHYEELQRRGVIRKESGRG